MGYDIIYHIGGSWRFAMTVVLIIGMISILVLFLSGYIFWVQYRNKKALIGRRLATILTYSGERRDELLEVKGNQLFDRIDKTESNPYFIRPDKSYDTWYPFGRPRLFQVSVKSFLYAENNPEPIDPFNRPLVMTSEVLGRLQNANFSKAMVGRADEAVEQMSPGKAKIPLPIYIALGVAIVASIIAILATLM